MASECCKTGFRWNGEPTGTETTVAKNKAYVTGTSKSVAIILIHDIFGWTFKNLRLLADHFAEEANATVYVPDLQVAPLFGGEIPATTEMMDDEEQRNKFDFAVFVQKHGKQVRWPEIEACAQALKSEFPKVGAIGYCYGAWACFKLAADPSLIDAVSVAHPSLLENNEIDGLKVPVQIVAPENDFVFTSELKEYSNKVIPTLGIPYEYVYFPGVSHGFAARGDVNDKVQKEALERAKRSAVNFFNEFLH
ncbi:endo-1,3-1,4-beta-D-glucanase [Clohesyomyces aquaticus]|uniref:Endo-1,3-1,4-beta-D-glucanase n=1 Tax=Clohesyomyces aquaticus TaxID=1231657 RepID=A0A1Y1Z6F2_9PLEO|nr:endo-1,3-1,4-beta-D-glucanase [Clohesyomyces aquaticus]